MYRNGVPIGCATLAIDNPARPLGTHVYTMLDGVAETASTFAPGRPGHRWMVVKTNSEKDETPLEALAQRVKVAPEFAEKVYHVVTPGTTPGTGLCCRDDAERLLQQIG